MEFDSFTKTGATRLAAKILNYWASKGLNGVKVWPEPLQMEDAEKTIIWQVRSNVGKLVNERIYRDSVLQ